MKYDLSDMISNGKLVVRIREKSQIDKLIQNVENAGLTVRMGPLILRRIKRLSFGAVIGCRIRDGKVLLIQDINRYSGIIFEQISFEDLRTKSALSLDMFKNTGITYVR